MINGIVVKSGTKKNRGCVHKALLRQDMSRVLLENKSLLLGN